MGAYENPQIIVPPDYGEIFRKNFEASKAQAEAAKERAQARRDKIKADNQRLDDRILQFDLARQEIKAGDLTQSLQQQTNFLADDFAENERLYSENQISREEYNKNRTSAFRKLNEMKGLAGILTQQSKEIQNVDQSDYQGGAVNGIGLIDAWKKGEIKFQYVGDEIEMYYKDGDGNTQIVDTNSLQEGEFFNINEKYAVSTEQLKNIGGGKTFQAEHRQGDTIKNANGVTVTLQEDQYRAGVSNEVFKEEKIREFTSNAEMQKLFDNNQDAGSIYMDTVIKELTVKEKTTDGKEVLKLSENGRDLINSTFGDKPKEEIDLIISQIESGQYNNANKSNLDQLSKRYVAEQSWNQLKGNLRTAKSTTTDKTVDIPFNPSDIDNYVGELYKNFQASDRAMSEPTVNRMVDYLNANNNGKYGYTIMKNEETNEYMFYNLDGNGNILTRKTGLPIDFSDQKSLTNILKGKFLSPDEKKKNLKNEFK